MAALGTGAVHHASSHLQCASARHAALSEKLQLRGCSQWPGVRTGAGESAREADDTWRATAFAGESRKGGMCQVMCASLGTVENRRRLHGESQQAVRCIPVLWRCRRVEKRGRQILSVRAADEGALLSFSATAGEESVDKSGESESILADQRGSRIVEEEPAMRLGGKVEEEISQAALIWRAVKLPLYTVAWIPLTVGAAAAYLQSGHFNGSRYSSFLLFSVLVIAWLNLSNDAFDSTTGADKDKKESVVNMTGSKTGVLVAAFACLLLGGRGFWAGARAAGDARVGWLLAAAVACGYVYQSPPFRLSYKGLGEPLCFLAFGPLATTAFYLYQANISGSTNLPAVTPTVLAASVLVGITTTLILFCSHFHQIEGDLAVGKMSPLVRMGTARAALVVQAAVGALYGLTGAFVAGGLLPFTCAIGALLTVPIGRLVVNFVKDNHQDKAKIFMAKYYCVRLHVAFGLALALGLATGSWRPF